jgi:site-specific recombinase XerD
MKSTASHLTKPKAQIPSSFSVHITDELRSYNGHLRDVRGLATSTSKGYLRFVGLFLQEIFRESAVEIGELHPDDIRQFLAAQMNRSRSASYSSCLAATLRSYLRYRATCGDQVSKLSAVILNPVHWKLASLPRALNSDQVERLLNSVSTARRWPKRGYAIVRCALDLGLRAGEIAHLMINDIDWRAGTVTLRQTKSLRQDVLPLPMETGRALADYLQHERPVTNHSAIFVRQMAGQEYPITSIAIQKIIKRACRHIGLPHSSAHALRHTVACRLVENGCSLKEVADLLRHRSLNTALIYAKLDTHKLAAVALPWPGSKS